MKLKQLTAASVAALLLALGGTTAFAHHGGGCRGYYGSGYYYGNGYRQQAVTYQTCPYEDCYETGTHQHGNDGCYYYGHYENDGHTHCAVTNGGVCYYGGSGYCHNHF